MTENKLKTTTNKSLFWKESFHFFFASKQISKLSATSRLMDDFFRFLASIEPSEPIILSSSSSSREPSVALTQRPDNRRQCAWVEIAISVSWHRRARVLISSVVFTFPFKDEMNALEKESLVSNSWGRLLFCMIRCSVEAAQRARQRGSPRKQPMCRRCHRHQFASDHAFGCSGC